MAEDKWYDAEVIRVEDVNTSVRRYWLRMNGLENFQFKAGQFITLDLPIHEKKNKRWRSYSIASAPDGSNVVELVIVLVEDGAGTPYIWKNFTPGHIVPAKGPLGHFTLPESVERDVCFVCTGTGVAPFRAMLLDLKNTGKSYKNMYLVFGCRTLDDVLYREELIKLQEELPRYQYIYCCSRENSDGFDGRTGYVHPVYEELFADRRQADFYLCGWKNMLDEAKKRLGEMGYTRDNIHVEVYG